MPESTMLKRFIIIIAGCFGVIGCSTDNQNLTVDKFTLRSIKIEDSNSSMVRGDQQKRLYGAVTIQEHKQRIGQYYSFSWNLLGLPESAENSNKKQPISLIFQYQQAATGKHITSIKKTYSLGKTEGTWQFNNIGNDYVKAGRILAWRAELFRGEAMITSKESYLWSK